MENGARRHSAIKWVAGIVAAAAATVLGVALTPIGEWAASLLGKATGQQDLVSWSEAPVLMCYQPFFIPNDSPTLHVPSIDPGTFKAAYSDDCKQLLAEVGGISTSIWTDVSIAAETDKPITLTRIEVTDVKQVPVPSGTFYTPAEIGGDYPAKYVAIDLDQTPVAPVDVGDMAVGGSVLEGSPDSVRTDPLTEDQMRLPWLVTKDEPLQLAIVGYGDSHDTTFSVELTWQAGEDTGTILMNNGGRGYRAVGYRYDPTAPNTMHGARDGSNTWIRYVDDSFE